MSELLSPKFGSSKEKLSDIQEANGLYMQVGKAELESEGGT